MPHITINTCVIVKPVQCVCFNAIYIVEDIIFHQRKNIIRVGGGVSVESSGTGGEAFIATRIVVHVNVIINVGFDKGVIDTIGGFKSITGGLNCVFDEGLGVKGRGAKGG